MGGGTLPKPVITTFHHEVHAGIDTLALILFRIASIHLRHFTFPLESLSTLGPGPTPETLLSLQKEESQSRHILQHIQLKR